MKRGCPTIAWLAVLGFAASSALATVVTDRWGDHATADHHGAPIDASPITSHPDWIGDNGDDILVGPVAGADRWGLLRFDLGELGPNTVVRSARLILWVTLHSQPPDAWLAVHQVRDPDGLGPFDEGAVTFNHRRPGIPWTSAGGDLAAAVGPGMGAAYLGNLPQYESVRLELDVSSAVRSWVADPASNAGLVLPAIDGTLVAAASHQHPDDSRRPILEVTLEAADNPERPRQPSWVQVAHRAGQSFITFAECHTDSDEPSFRIYRHTEPIHAGNLDDAAMLAEIPPGSGHYVQEDTLCPAGGGCSPIGQVRFIITDDGPPLPAEVGLWVHTVHAGESGQAYYAVTTVVEGNENRDDFQVNQTGPVTESHATPRPVRVWTNDTDTGWVYTQFMDTRTWNGAVDGWAYNAYVGVPEGYDPSGPALPLAMRLHAWGESYRPPASSGGGGTEAEWPVVWVMPDDPSNTWWFGFGVNAGHRERRLADAPVVNFTQQRLDALLDFVQAEFAVDQNRIYLDGGSMGGAGALAYGLRRGARFAAVYSGKGMTDFARAGVAGGVAWEEGSITALWGTVADDLPTNLGPSVWEFMDLRSWAEAAPAAETPFLACHHGILDDVIDWETQGLPWYPALEAGNLAFVGVFNDEDHNFDDYWAADSPAFRYQDFALRRDELLPAFARASSSDAPSAGVGCRNCRLQWSSSWNPFDGPPVDESDRASVAVRSTDGLPVTVDVTLHRAQHFTPPPGTRIDWRVVSGGTVGQEGTLIVPDSGRITIPAVEFGPTAHRLELSGGLLFADGFESGDLHRWSARTSSQKSRPGGGQRSREH